MISMHLCPRQLLCFCRRLGAFAMHISMVLLSMFVSPPLRGAGPMALMPGHEWQHIYKSRYICALLVTCPIGAWCLAAWCCRMHSFFFHVISGCSIGFAHTLSAGSICVPCLLKYSPVPAVHLYNSFCHPQSISAVCVGGALGVCASDYLLEVALLLPYIGWWAVYS
jgi:hypothetical protein